MDSIVKYDLLKKQKKHIMKSETFTINAWKHKSVTVLLAISVHWVC